MTYLEELFEKADRLHQDIRIISGNIYLGAKLYDTFTLSTIRPLLDIINSCPNGRYKDYCFTNPRSQRCPRFQSGEELANSVGKINAYYSL